MYLLKPDEAGNTYTLEGNLHSTMYLLKPRADGKGEHYNSFTFHYVSIKTILS